MGRRVRISRSDGELGTIDEGELQKALDSGFRVVTDEEATEIKRRREAQSVGGKALTFAEAAAGEATFGGATAIAGALLGDEYKENRKARAQYNEDAALVGAVTGGVGSALLTGGVAKAGEMAAVRALGAGAKAKVAASALRGAAEGVAAGAGTEIHESLIEGREITGERLGAGMVMGALFGGGLSGGATLGGQMLAGAAKAPVEGVQKLLGRQLGSAGEETSEAVARAVASDNTPLLQTAYEKTTLLGVDREAASGIGGLLAKDPKRLHRVASNQKAFEQQVASVVQDDLNAVRTAVDDVHKAVGGQQKYRAIRDAIPASADEKQLAQRVTEKVRQEVDDLVQDMKAANARSYGRAYDPGVVDQMDRLSGRTFQELVEGKSAAAAFESVDRMKRDMAQLVERTGGWGKPPPGVTTDVQAVNGKARDIYGRLKQHLEREDVFGDAAKMQARENAAYAASAAAAKDFRHGAKGSGISNLFREDGEINMRTAINVVRQHRRVGGAEVASKLDDTLERQLEYFRALKETRDLAPDVAKRIDDAEIAVKRMRKNMEGLSEDAEILNWLENAREVEGSRSVSIGAMSTLGPALASGVGLSLAGPAGAAVGAIAGSATRPYTTARHLAALLSMADGVTKKTDAGLAPMLRRIKGLGGKAARAAGGAVSRAKSAATATGVRVMSRKDRKRETERVSREAMRLASNPEALVAAVRPHVEAMDNVAPGLAGAVQATAQRGALFLATKAPVVYTRPLAGGKPVLDPVSAAQYLRYVDAVRDPAGTLAKLDTGGFTVEHAEAIETVYPAMMDGVRKQVVDEMLLAQQAGRPVPFRDRIQAGVLLGVPTDESLEPSFLAELQARYGQAGATGDAMDQAQPRGEVRAVGGRQINPESRMGPSERITAGLARA